MKYLKLHLLNNRLVFIDAEKIYSYDINKDGKVVIRLKLKNNEVSRVEVVESLHDIDQQFQMGD